MTLQVIQYSMRPWTQEAVTLQCVCSKGAMTEYSAGCWQEEKTDREAAKEENRFQELAPEH